MDTLAMLEELLEQDQFELLIPKDGMSGELRLVYLMNDAVESFLVFKNARMTGAYLEDYEGYDKKQLRKMTHLERKEGTVYLFDYRHRNPYTGQARIQEVTI